MSEDEALIELLRLLKAADYRFTAVTPATHERVLARPCDKPDLRDIFGWNRGFSEADVDTSLLDCLQESETLERLDGGLRSRIRVASLGDDLFLHSAHPTAGVDAVFFGPDTYRFVRFVREQFAELAAQPRWIVDMGAGSGAGAISAAHLAPNARVTAIDVNSAALRFASINAEAAGVRLETCLDSALPGGPELVIANPPYIMDAAGRTYRDGGGLFGGEVALDWTAQSLERLAPGGTMLLYTGAAVVGGRTPLTEELQRACTAADAEFHAEETDADVFGEELDRPAYGSVERIAVICAVIRKR